MTLGRPRGLTEASPIVIVLSAKPELSAMCIGTSNKTESIHSVLKRFGSSLIVLISHSKLIGNRKLIGHKSNVLSLECQCLSSETGSFLHIILNLSYV